MLEMECWASTVIGSAPEGSMSRGRQSKTDRTSRDVKEKVRLVVGDLETVVTELRAIVVDLRLLVHQIDIVTAKLDSKIGLDWRGVSDKDTLSEGNRSISNETVRQPSPPRTDGYVQCCCNRFQLHRVVYMPGTPSFNPDKTTNMISGYCLETDIAGKGFKPKLLPCLDYNQNESFDTEYLETLTSPSAGSELLPPNATSEEESRCGLSDLDKLASRTKTYQDNNTIWERGSYSGFYENEVDDKLENYVNIVDSFESSDEDDVRDMDSFRIISSLPDATDAKTRYDMVSSWAECAMISLASDNLTSDDTDTLPEDPGKHLLPVKDGHIPKSSVGEYNFVSDVVLFQHEVQSDVGQYRSVLVF